MKRVLVLIAAMLVAVPAVAGPTRYVCWNGTVVKNPKQCPPVKIPVVCSDGTVVTSPEQCPPIKICLDGTLTSGECPPPPISDPTLPTE